jgi:poly(A) polymerase
VFIRYGRDQNGAVAAKAFVYTAEEHGIDPSKIDESAITIVKRLKANNYQAYIVGGAVRDLILGRTPKDFDLVTDAVPNKIKRIFSNARIIGRRFRLVHIYSGRNIYELSTFRSIAKGSIGNEFGTMDEDAHRRDFTLNALYYDPTERLLVDFVGGFQDIKRRKIKPIIPLDTIFKEDPVRMVRGVKYAVASGFSMPFMLKRAIRHDAKLLGDISPSRLTEEFFKILASGKARAILSALFDYKLLEHMAPKACQRISLDKEFRDRFFADLDSLDTRRISIDDIRIEEDTSKRDADPADEQTISILLSCYLHSFVELLEKATAPFQEMRHDVLTQVKEYLFPLNPPRMELENAISIIFSDLGLIPQEKAKRPRRRRKAAGQA